MLTSFRIIIMDFSEDAKHPWMEYGDYLATKNFFIPQEEWNGFNNRIKYADCKVSMMYE